MSLSELAISRERGEGTRWQWSALPVFPAKAFLWFGLYVNSEAGIQGIQDLRGKRVGVPDYAARRRRSGSALFSGSFTESGPKTFPGMLAGPSSSVTALS